MERQENFLHLVQGYPTPEAIVNHFTDKVVTAGEAAIAGGELEARIRVEGKVLPFPIKDIEGFEHSEEPGTVFMRLKEEITEHKKSSAAVVLIALGALGAATVHYIRKKH